MNKSKNKTLNYLKNLTKEELINLIINFAPESFFDTIQSQFASEKEALVIFNQASKRIDTIFGDENLLYNPSEFEDELLNQLEKLRGLWDKLPLQIGDLLVRIIEKVEELFEDGYLYIEKYGEEDDYFESEELNEYIVKFVRNLSPERKSNYLENLQKILHNFGYSTFLSIEKKLF